MTWKAISLVLTALLLLPATAAAQLYLGPEYANMKIIDTVGLLLIMVAVYCIARTITVYGGVIGRGFKVLGAGAILLFIARLSGHVMAYYGITPIPHFWADVLYLIAFALLTGGFYLTYQAAVKIREAEK